MSILTSDTISKESPARASVANARRADVKAPAATHTGPPPLQRSRLKRGVMITSGMACVGFGAAGIVLPLVPTTPFLLLATALFARSSRRFNRWLLNHKTFGPYIHAFRSKSGLTKHQKLRIAFSLVAVTGISAVFVPVVWVRVMLGGICAFWLYMLNRMPTREGEAAQSSRAAR